MDEHARVQEFVAHSTQVNCVSIGPKSSQVIATGGEDADVNIWRVGSVNNIWKLKQNKAPIECVCFDTDEVCVVSGALNGSVKVFDLNEGKLARGLTGHSTAVTSMDYHPHAEFLVTGSADCTVSYCSSVYCNKERELFTDI